MKNPANHHAEMNDMEVNEVQVICLAYYCSMFTFCQNTYLEEVDIRLG